MFFDRAVGLAGDRGRSTTSHDEGEETLTVTLSNASGGRLTDGWVTGTIENTDLMPAALLARFGRAMGEQVVAVVEERMVAPRERGFQARFAGRELQAGQRAGLRARFPDAVRAADGHGSGGRGPDGRRRHGRGPDGDGVARSRSGRLRRGHAGMNGARSA